MKILYYGGQKSGKSLLAEKKILSLSSNLKPYYIATYNNLYNDLEMKNRINTHKKQRQDNFITIEEPYNLIKIIKDKEFYLIDCISMWILNTLDKPLDELLDYLDELFKIDATIVFVLNDVGNGVIPMDKESRLFVDRSGIIGQKIASLSDKVYHIVLGLERELK
ncbi:Adenosylcobinamide-phosphate guanylyltransferase [hydrothermal vent metagenome]|uniref:Adenosylcobinamide kinase n=1 Tax=hydrothermal vent metagenome TaxID=652676 RepID=A0A1W1C8B1_9ZZZZ